MRQIQGEIDGVMLKLGKVHWMFKPESGRWPLHVSLRKRLGVCVGGRGQAGGPGS